MPRWMISLVTLTAFLLALIVPIARARADEGSGPPPPGDELAQAQQHFQAGKQAFTAGDYQSAIREFKAAQAIKPSAKLDYNIAIAYEQLNRPRAAIKYFRSYLAGTPAAENRGEVEQKLAQLEAQAQAQPAAPPGVDEQQLQQQQQPPPPNGNPQYQYSGEPPPVVIPQPAQSQKKKSYWWVIFPILGGATLIVVLCAYALFSLSVATRYYYYSSVPPTGAVGFEPAVHGPAAGDSSGLTLFRF